MLYRKIYSRLLLVIGLIFTIIASVVTFNDIQKSIKSEFLFSCNEVNNKIKARLNAQAQVLHSGVGLFGAKDTVTRKDWKTFVDQSRFLQDLPGILGIGYSMLVPSKNRERLTQQIHDEGYPDYAIKPSGNRDIYSAIIYLEPLSGRNLRAFGYDLLYEQVRRKALETARDLNLPILSRKVTLVQETNNDVQAGTLMFLPVYRKGYTINTIQERRKAIAGWVYSPYRMNDMMAGILGNWENKNGTQLSLIVYDGIDTVKKAILYKHVTENHHYNVNSFDINILTVDFNTTQWTLKFLQPKASPFSARFSLFWLILLSGLTISILLYLLLQALIKTRQNAQLIAEGLTNELKVSETRLRFAIEGSKLGTWDWNIETGSVIFNDYWSSMLGYSNDELSPNVEAWENLVHPEDLPSVKEILSRHLNGEIDHYQTEHRVKTKQNDWKWILDTGKVTERDAKGKPVRMVGTHIDITERKQTEILNQIEHELLIKLSTAESLDETMRLCLKAAITYAQMDAGAIYIADDKDKSLSLIHHEGLPQEFIEKTSFYPSGSPDTQVIFKGDPLFCSYSQANNGTFYNDQKVLKAFAIIPIVHLGDVVGCISIGSFALHEVSCVSKTILDRIASYIGSFIIQAKHEDKLNQNRQDLNTLFNTFDDFLFILDLNGTFIYFNSTINNRLQYQTEDLFDKHFTNLFQESFHEKINNHLDRALEGEETKFMIPLVSKNGEEIHTETKILPGMWSGKKALIAISHDITDRKNYESQLKQNSERLEMALLASNAGLWDWNIKTGELVINEKWSSMRGYKLNEITMNVHTWESMVHPDDKDFVISVLNEHIENKTTFYQVEYRTETKNGSYIWILDTGKITEFGKNGEPLRMVGTNIDITSRKKDEFKLQQNLSQQELLSEIALKLNTIDDFDNKINLILADIGLHNGVSRVYIFEDESGGLTTSNIYEWCNEGITAQKDDLQNIPYDMIPSWKSMLLKEGRVYSENISQLPEDLQAILEPQDIKSIIVYPLFVKGDFFGFIGFDECVRYKNWTKSELELLRTVSGIIANAYERKLSEKSLKESEAKNRAILESMPDILFHFNKQGVILSFRSSSLNDLALAPELFLNKPVVEIFPVEFAEMVQQAILTCLETGFTKLEYSIPVNNILTYFEARMAKMNDHEVITIVRNVSERKEYERQLKEERDRANLANIAKSEFLANMSHEIRTPMNAILGFSEALYHQLEVPNHKKMVKSVLSSGNLLLSLLNDILDLSKIEAGKLEILPQPTDFTGIIQEIKLLFTDKALEKGIEIKLNIDADFPRVLMLDEIRIKQVVFNLIGNAIKFTHAGFVELTAAFVKTDDRSGELTFMVKDTGIGIHESHQQVIFEAFMQQSGQSNRKYGGTGLGLAISKRLVEKMGGTITVSSVVDEGSLFAVQLPDIQISSSKISNNEYHIEDRNIVYHQSSILVVDDVPSNIEMIENLLSDANLIISTAENGEIALQILNNILPDLILLDLRMPGIDGYEVARYIKENPKLSHVPIIALTASVFSTDKIESSGKFDDILFKPVNKAALTLQLCKYLPFTELPMDQSPSEIAPKGIELTSRLEEKLPEIELILKEKYLPLWDTLKDSLVLFSIEMFAKDLKTMALHFEFDYLMSYAIRIIEDLEMVDLESLKSDLQRFPKIVDEISKLIQIK